MVASFAMMFALMTSYTRARAESLIAKCKVGFMERPERIVLFMIGAFTNRMAGVLWVILVLSIFSVVDRVILTYRVLEKMPDRPIMVSARRCRSGCYGTFSSGRSTARPGSTT